MPKPTLAKLTPPRISAAVPRERLFSALDACRAAAMIWVCGPPGAGKTTTVAGWIAHRKLPGFWYQVDAADQDPAIFFSCLGLALSTAQRKTLPRFEPHCRLTAFAHRFFRAYFACLPEHAVLVLDGLIAPEKGSTLDLGVRAALLEVPSGRNIVVAARETLPAHFAREQVHQLVAVVDWELLKLTPQECREIAGAVTLLPEDAQALLYRQSEGWVAGVRILLEHYRRTGRLMQGVPGRDSLLGYFGSEIFDSLPSATQGVLLRTCMLPTVTRTAAERLTGESDALSRLDELSTRQLFVSRLDSGAALYEYHALFREFLSARAREVLGPSEFHAVQRQTANLLLDAGQAELALPLLAEANDFFAVGRVILKEASHLLAHGHWHTLRDWVKRLPRWYLDTSPRLLYCAGLAQSLSEPELAVKLLERAYRRFGEEQNDHGQCMAAAAILQTRYMAFDDFHGTGAWIAAIRAHIGRGVAFTSIESELHARAMVVVTMTFTEPADPWLAACAEQTLELITRGAEINQTFVAASALLPYFDLFASEKARLLVAYAQPLLGNVNITEFNRLWWLLATCLHYHFEDDKERFIDAANQVRGVARNSQAQVSPAMLSQLDLWEAYCRPEHVADPDLLRKAIAAVDPRRRQEELNLRVDAAAYLLMRGDAQAAAAHDTALKFSLAENYALLAHALCELGQTQEGADAAAQAVRIVPAAHGSRLAFDQALMMAHSWLTRGEREQASTWLVQALEVGRERGYINALFWFPRIMARLCAHAIAHDIETSYVRDLIRRHRLKPALDAACEQWPWEVRIFALGGFEIWAEKRTITFSGKVPKKPLELLKLLVARGNGGLEGAAAAQQLWPDAPGDDAENVLRMTLHRLRKMLGRDEFVLLQDGKVRLNRELCWVDTWRFETVCDTLRAHANGDLSGKLADEALRLYRGPAFDGEEPQVWMLASRERWRGKFVALVKACSLRLRQCGDAQGAAAMLQRGIDAEPLAEELYQELMACLLSEGNRAEAYAAYRRCRDTLSITLGLKPSGKTETLRQQAAAER